LHLRAGLSAAFTTFTLFLIWTNEKRQSLYFDAISQKTTPKRDADRRFLTLRSMTGIAVAASCEAIAFSLSLSALSDR
jgi:hypothetical protein